MYRTKFERVTEAAIGFTLSAVFYGLLAVMAIKLIAQCIGRG